MEDNIEINIVKANKNAFITEQKIKDKKYEEFVTDKVMIEGDYSSIVQNTNEIKIEVQDNLLVE